MTSDAEKARNFYKALFDWTFVIGGPESGYYSMANLGDDHVAGLGPLPQNMDMPSMWSVYFASADIDATAARVKAYGGHVTLGPMDVMEEGRMALCVDSTGAVFGVWQPKRHIGAMRVDQPGTMAWREVVSVDAAKARDYYANVFGLTAQPVEGMEYWTLHKGDTVVCGVMQANNIMHSGMPSHWMTYFAVSDTDAAAKKLQELGGKLFTGPFDSPYGRIATAADPMGAAFSIIKPSR
jgi:predicted enzyme related to lactoylglutathione lyase